MAQGMNPMEALALLERQHQNSPTINGRIRQLISYIRSLGAGGDQEGSRGSNVVDFRFPGQGG